MQFVQDSASQKDGYTLRWVTETSTGISIPRIESGAPSSHLKILNEKLEQLHFNLIAKK